MSNQLRTPHRSNLFDDVEQPFTPCTRLSRMTIESQSLGNSRFRKTAIQPATNLTDRLAEAAREETSSTPHRNLDMFLGSDRISMSKDGVFSEDEDSDDGDLFSSTLCPMSSPERPLTRQSIFEDESMNSPPEMSVLSRSIFDEEEDEEEDNYDPSGSWLSQIFFDAREPVHVHFAQESQEEQENQPPSSRNKERKIRPVLREEQDEERPPLREIRCEEEEDALPAKKKSLLANGKPQKMRYMRSLSPPRYAKRKGESSMPLASVL